LEVALKLLVVSTQLLDAANNEENNAIEFNSVFQNLFLDLLPY